ncbi:hypothetical protein Tco_0638462 [Tanacetum coccineum]
MNILSNATPLPPRQPPHLHRHLHNRTPLPPSRLPYYRTTPPPQQPRHHHHITISTQSPPKGPPQPHPQGVGLVVVLFFLMSVDLASFFLGCYTDCEDLQLNATLILMANKVQAYDLDCDDTPIASAIFMEKQSSTGSINGDDAGPSYDTNILSEVPNYDTYHANDMFNPFIQELPDSEQPVSVNDTYVDFLSDSNVIFDNPYADTNEDVVVQDMPSLSQNDVAILSLIENMQHEVTRFNTVNLESKKLNESLTIELERYRENIKFLESEKESKLVFTSTEKDLGPVW